MATFVMKGVIQLFSYFVNAIYLKLIIIFTLRIPISEKYIFQNVTFYDCNTLPLFSIKLFANSCI